MPIKTNKTHKSLHFNKIFLLSLISIMVVLVVTFITITYKNNTVSKAENLKIIGGRDVLPGEYPYVVRIPLPSGRCTGVLIHPRWILTAAHCISDDPEEKPKYVDFELLNNDDGKYYHYTVNVLKAIKHQYYSYEQNKDDYTISNDISLLLLENEIIDIPIPKIPKPGIDDDLYYSGNMFTVLGWGYKGYTPTTIPAENQSDREWKRCAQFADSQGCNGEGFDYNCRFHFYCNLCIPFNETYFNQNIKVEDTDCNLFRKKIEAIKKDNTVQPIEKQTSYPIYPDILQVIEFPIISPSLSKYPNQYVGGYLDERTLLYNHGVGDSGGPALITKNNILYLIGLTSSGPFRDREGFVGTGEAYYTRVLDYYDWIEDELKSMIHPPAKPHPLPLVYSFNIDYQWDNCYKYKTESQCYQNRDSCGYYSGCDLCLPWDNMDLWDKFMKNDCDYLENTLDERIKQKQDYERIRRQRMERYIPI